MGTVEVKGMRIGAGVPKTIVSLMGFDEDALTDQAAQALAAGADCLEWRADGFADVRDGEAVLSCARALGSVAQEAPLLFTLRTAGQGGYFDASTECYLELERAVIESGLVDMVDVEIGVGDEHVRQLCDLASRCGVVPVVSHHDFRATPAADDIVALMQRMAGLGAGMAKVSVMACDAHDALRLLCASEQFSRESDVPAIALAMGAQGSVTRLVGEQFGSAMTFCSLQGASAPGQVPLDEAKQVMDVLHGLLF